MTTVFLFLALTVFTDVSVAISFHPNVISERLSTIENPQEE
jgi:hypothetical protein